MLLEYVQGAMRLARYKILEGDEGYFGEIPGFAGVWANADTLEECRNELQSVLEDWMVVKLRHNDGDLPLINGIDLNSQRAPDQEVA